jgi:hypothetical protein
MGIMTHLDAFKNNKTLQNAKKAIKHRFWTEIYKGKSMVAPLLIMVSASVYTDVCPSIRPSIYHVASTSYDDESQLTHALSL